MANTQMATIQPVTAAVSTAGGWMQTVNSGLSSAMDLWLQYENVRKVKSTSGGDQVSKQTVAEHENGAGIVVDPISTTAATATKETVPESGIVINKGLLYGSLGLLGLALVLKISR